MASQRAAGDTAPRVVIVGGGVIGSAIAYFLSLRGVAATIVERTEIACAASGLATAVVPTICAEIAHEIFSWHVAMTQYSHWLRIRS